jgi:Arc/MetJ family transcription regulator
VRGDFQVHVNSILRPLISGAKTKKEAVEKALEEYIKRRKSKKLIGLEGKIELSFDLEEFLERRKKDVPYT